MTDSSFFHALKWAYSANWGEKALSTVFTLALAAVLGPREFGVISLALVYISFIQMLLNQGFTAALIQKKNLHPKHLNSVLWMNLGLGFFLATGSFLLSRWWAACNHAPELEAVIKVLSVCIPVEALAIVQSAWLQRNMDFKSLSLRTNASVVLGGIVGVTMAFGGFGVWALVAQQIARDLSALTLVWLRSSFRPSLNFSWPHLRDLLHFSSANFTAQLAIFFDAQSGSILMGTMFGPVAVGLYRLAERLVNAVSSATTTSIQSVSLPQFSRQQGSTEGLRRSALMCIRLSAIATLPAMAGLASISSGLMTTVGPAWAPAAGVLRILSILGMFTMFSIFTGPLLQALSRAVSLAVLEWSRTALSVGALFVAAMFVRNGSTELQITGIAVARIAVGACIVMPVFLAIVMRLAGVAFHQLVKVVAPAVSASAAVVMSVALLQHFALGLQMHPAAALASQILVGALVGSGTLLWLDRNLRFELLSTFRGRPALQASFREPA